jgi:hypothetical protein
MQVRIAIAWMLLSAVALTLCPTGQARAETRVALVIGNGGYRHAPALANPANDAADVAASLERLHFSVHRLINASYDDMRRTLLEFGHEARRADIAIVFYAGHGMEIAGENWLIPVDAVLKADTDIEQEAISLRSVTIEVSGAAKLGLVSLDACRDNPFAAHMQRTAQLRSAVPRGLVRVEPSGSVLVAYAAKDGTTAADGNARNSPFTAALLRYIETPGLEVNFLFRDVHDDVLTATEQRQEPYVYGALSKDPIFLASLPAAANAPIAPAGPTPDEAAWDLIKDTGNIDVLRRFISQFPESPRRRDAEQRVDRLAALPTNNQPSGPARPAVERHPRQKAKPRPVQPSHAPARQTGRNCFAFNGRQMCE